MVLSKNLLSIRLLKLNLKSNLSSWDLIQKGSQFPGIVSNWVINFRYSDKSIFRRCLRTRQTVICSPNRNSLLSMLRDRY